jgi:AI-2 transport protein TqsA
MDKAFMKLPVNKPVSFASVLLSIVLVAYILVVGRGLLMPIIMAIFIWHLLNTITNSVKNTPTIGKYIPYAVCMLIALGIVTFFVIQLVNIITNNVNEVIGAIPRYQDNFMHIMAKLDEKYKVKILAHVQQFIQNISVQRILVNVYGVFTSLTSSALIISLYVIFLFIEQHAFRAKMNALFNHSNQKEIFDNIMSHIIKDTQTYIGLKSLMSLITATSSWIIMKWVGLDFAEFWALLIFFLNFIPNIGSIIATIFPAILALVQFQSWGPFSIITGGIIIVQFIVGNIIEPRLMGNSLNLSPLVILFALGVWGTLWGILGMFLSVPITVMMMIVFAHFERTRPIAIFLSQDGNVAKAYEKL